MVSIGIEIKNVGDGRGNRDERGHSRDLFFVFSQPEPAEMCSPERRTLALSGSIAVLKA